MADRPQLNFLAENYEDTSIFWKINQMLGLRAHQHEYFAKHVIPNDVLITTDEDRRVTCKVNGTRLTFPTDRISLAIFSSTFRSYPLRELEEILSAVQSKPREKILQAINDVLEEATTRNSQLIKQAEEVFSQCKTLECNITHWRPKETSDFNFEDAKRFCGRVQVSSFDQDIYPQAMALAVKMIKRLDEHFICYTVPPSNN